jgi:hypothetical protein
MTWMQRMNGRRPNRSARSFDRYGGSSMAGHLDVDCGGCLELARAIADSVPAFAWPTASPPTHEVSTPGVASVRIAGKPDAPRSAWFTTIEVAHCDPPRIRLGASVVTPRRHGIGEAIWFAMCRMLRRHGIEVVYVRADELGRTFWARDELATTFDPAYASHHGSAFARWRGRVVLIDELSHVVTSTVLATIDPQHLDRLIAAEQYEELGQLITEHSAPRDWARHVGTWIEAANWYGIVELFDLDGGEAGPGVVTST